MPRHPPEDGLRTDDPSVSTWIDRFVVEPAHEGWRLDRYLTAKLHRATRSQVTRFLRGDVRVEGRDRVKAGMVVRSGDVVTIRRREARDPGAPQTTALNPLWQDERVIVVDKPPGLLVHATAHEGAWHVQAILERCWPGERVEPMHRLDRDTSGCLLCARGLSAIQRFRRAFAENEITKHYAALVDDPGARWVPGAHALLDTPLGFDRSSDVHLRIGVGAWPCRTHVRCVARSSHIALLEVRIEGGRQHQIRAHLAMAGTPVVGDKLYGMGDAFFIAWRDTPGDEALSAKLALRWHALHAAALRWSLEGQAGHAASPLPRAWEALWPGVSARWAARALTSQSASP